jgi:hypothetical protein
VDHGRRGTVANPPQRASSGPFWRRSVWRLLAAFSLGCVAALSGFVFGMPGKGEFVPIIWLAAFVAILIAPGWPGFVALISGVTVCAALLDVSDGVFGLVFLIVAIVSALAAHGALSASVLLRLRSLGLSPGSRDARVLAGGGIALVLVLIFAWFATELVRNPA